ncbi:MAG: cyclodeaminase/cyclohydrolase family protein [Candidatus Humimicrobiia bacterium]
MKDFLNKLASDSPTPGGGSASAASGAMGAALLSMVYAISRKKILKTLEKERKEVLNIIKREGENKAQKGEGEDKVQKRERRNRVQESKNFYEEEKTQKVLIKKLKKSADEAKMVMNKLLLLVDDDARAYENVLRKLKKLRKIKIDDSKREIDISKTKEDIQEAYKNAAEVTLQTAGLCHKILKISKNLSEKVYSPVKSDFKIAISLLKVGIEGAALNVNLNLNEIDDKNFVDKKRKELNKILKYLD